MILRNNFYKSKSSQTKIISIKRNLLSCFLEASLVKAVASIIKLPASIVKAVASMTKFPASIVKVVARRIKLMDDTPTAGASVTLVVH